MGMFPDGVALGALPMRVKRTFCERAVAVAVGSEVSPDLVSRQGDRGLLIMKKCQSNLDYAKDIWSLLHLIIAQEAVKKYQNIYRVL